MKMSEQTASQTENEDFPDSNRSDDGENNRELDLLPDMEETEAAFSERELFNISHWGCIGFLVILGVVAAATVVQLIGSLLDQGSNLRSPVFIWLFAIILMIGVIAALAWTRVVKRR